MFKLSSLSRPASDFIPSSLIPCTRSRLMIFRFFRSARYLSPSSVTAVSSSSMAISLGKLCAASSVESSKTALPTLIRSRFSSGFELLDELRRGGSAVQLDAAQLWHLGQIFRTRIVDWSESNVRFFE